ncbi:MAG: tyrosine-type recombinase/integrase [Candidatus Dormibacteria bacterium]
MVSHTGKCTTACHSVARWSWALPQLPMAGRLLRTPMGRPLGGRSPAPSARPWCLATRCGAPTRPLLERAGLPLVRLHDLRHTAATVMLGRGVHPKIASEMLGHATVGITLDTYSHVTETMQRTAIRAIEAALAEG